MYETTLNNYRDAAQVNTAMGRVYGHMMLAVITSMIVSAFVGMTPELVQFFFTGAMKWIVIFAPLAAVFVVSPILANDPSPPVAIGGTPWICSTHGSELCNDLCDLHNGVNLHSLHGRSRVVWYNECVWILY